MKTWFSSYMCIFPCNFDSRSEVFFSNWRKFPSIFGLFWWKFDQRDFICYFFSLGVLCFVITTSSEVLLGSDTLYSVLFRNFFPPRQNRVKNKECFKCFKHFLAFFLWKRHVLSPLMMQSSPLSTLHLPKTGACHPPSPYIELPTCHLTPKVP